MAHIRSKIKERKRERRKRGRDKGRGGGRKEIHSESAKSQFTKGREKESERAGGDYKKEEEEDKWGIETSTQVKEETENDEWS